MTADATEGIWTYVMELARGLYPSGVEILLAVMGPGLSAEQRAEALQLSHVGLCEKPFALEWMQDPWREVTQAGDWLLELEEEFAPQVVHLNHYCYGSLPWSAPVLISAHGCVLSWWQAIHGEQLPNSWSRYHAEVSAGLRGANLVTAPTQAMFDSLTRLYAPIPRQPHFQNPSRFPEFRTIPNGCAAGRFKPLAKRSVVLSMGSTGDEAMNFELLDTVAADLPWPVAVTGKGELAEFPHLHSINVSNSDALATRLGLASIFALPVRYDPFGFAPLQAALAGCALVLGDIPSLRETWGDAALFASPDNPSAFATVLGAVVEDSGLRQEMVIRARERALELTPDRMAGCILECYQSLTLRHAAPVEADVP